MIYTATCDLYKMKDGTITTKQQYGKEHYKKYISKQEDFYLARLTPQLANKFKIDDGTKLGMRILINKDFSKIVLLTDTELKHFAFKSNEELETTDMKLMPMITDLIVESEQKMINAKALNKDIPVQEESVVTIFNLLKELEYDKAYMEQLINLAKFFVKEYQAKKEFKKFKEKINSLW